MPESALTWVTGLGEIAGVVLVVIYFLKYMKSRDDGMKEIIGMLRQEFASTAIVIQKACEVMGEVTATMERCKKSQQGD
jgi:hypothetical protein